MYKIVLLSTAMHIIQHTVQIIFYYDFFFFLTVFRTCVSISLKSKPNDEIAVVLLTKCSEHAIGICFVCLYILQDTQIKHENKST